jgi:RHS repeat-associated protein
MWDLTLVNGEWRWNRHIYVGNVRVVTKNGKEGNWNTGDERDGTYYYHGDHVGSAQVVTNHEGKIYERYEYTPYGEVWIEWENREVARNEKLPYRFTGKELDEETGLYYYGARYLDPRASRWLSADPAVGEYIPVAPVNEEARRRNGNLPGMGGIYNTVNLHVYHYAGNNPVKYTDPDGRDIVYQDDNGNEVQREASERNEVHTPASDKALLERNAETMKKNYLNIFFFAKKVNTGGGWDFKDKERKDYRGHYWFNGDLIDAVEFGNIHYGYVGNAGGIPTSLLIDAPGIAQIKRNTAMLSYHSTNFDDPEDTANIIKGINTYNSGFMNTFSRTFLDVLYNLSGVRIIFLTSTAAYYGLHSLKRKPR